MSDYILATNNFESTLLTKAKGSWVWDTNDKKYLDFESGCWSTNLGHNHPKITEALKKQLDKIIHRSMFFLTEETITAAKNLVKFLPHRHEKVTFLSSGSEAVEFALNFALKATKKEKILSLKDGYYGSFGIAKESSYYSKKASKLRIDYPRCYKDSCNCLDTYSELIDMVMKNYAKNLGCFALEPVMVSGGIHKPCRNFINELVQRLQEENIPVLANEVTAGWGRTGKHFGHEYFDFKPDIISLGKAMGNGYPVSAVVTSAELETKIPSADLYYAQSHQLDPLGCVAANTVIDIYRDEKIIQKSQEAIGKLREFIKALNYPFIKETRVIGMLLAIEIIEYKEQSSHDIILKIKNGLIQNGLLHGYSLRRNIIRFLPPLTISDEEITYFKNTVIKVFDEIKNKIE